VPLCFSIADGLALGFIAYPVVKLLSGTHRRCEVADGLALWSAAFVLCVPPTSDAMNELAIEQLQRRIRVARGQEAGDVALVGGQVVNVFTRQVEPANVVVADGWIAGVGLYDWEARERIDVSGQFVLPGLIDAHMHLESTLLTPAELARVVVPHGTATIIADPHEVGNVQGVRGIELLLAASAGLPLDIFFMAPSCVPCTSWEHAGARLSAAEIGQLLSHERVLGLAEVMDFPALLAGAEGVLAKIAATAARGGRIDGHAPGMIGRDLAAYAAAGIRSDHESTTVEEALAKAALGMLVQVREGSSARNLETLLPLLLEDRLGDWCLCTDDIHPQELMRVGHIDDLLRRVIAAGVPAAKAVRHATLVPARHYGLRDRGGVAPGYRANLLVVDNLSQLNSRLVLHSGRVVARGGAYLAPTVAPSIPEENTVRIGRLSERDFQLQLSQEITPVIVASADQIVTQREDVRLQAGRTWLFDPLVDLALVASIERHRATGQIGLALVRGFGFQRGCALGSSVAHDSHNLIIAGTHPREMLCCAQALADIGGGFIVVSNGRVVAQAPLEIAGLISRADAASVCRQMAEVETAARQMGCPLPSPFGTLSFLALSVIPELRITDQGLFDVTRQAFVPV
jgi:adenine deaminase